MSSTLFIINDAPYGNERAYNALRLAGALSGKEGEQVRVFLMADAVGMAEAEFIEGAKRGTMAQLAEWTMQADKVLVF